MNQKLSLIPKVGPLPSTKNEIVSMRWWTIVNTRNYNIFNRFITKTPWTCTIRPNLDYADIIYDKLLNKYFKRKIEMVQYNAVLIITGAFKGTSCVKINQELDLESLADRRWTRKLFFFFHKIILVLLPSYLKDYLIPCDKLRTYLTRSSTQKRI